MIVYARHCDAGMNNCPICKRAYNLAYRLAHAESERKRKREYMKSDRVANPEKVRAHDRSLYHASPRRQAQAKASSQKARKKNPIANQAARLRRVHAELGAPGRYTGPDVQAQFNAQDGKCFYCAKQLLRFHIDHKVPISRGGTNWPYNIVCACARCNLRKGARPAEEFFAILASEKVAA